MGLEESAPHQAGLHYWHFHLEEVSAGCRAVSVHGKLRSMLVSVVMDAFLILTLAARPGCLVLAEGEEDPLTLCRNDQVHEVLEWKARMMI